MSTWPAAAVAAETGSLIDALLRNEEKMCGLGGRALGKAQDTDHRLEDRIFAAAEGAAAIPAASPQGALFQLVVALAVADSLLGCADDEWTKQAENWYRQIEGCVWSAIGLIEQESDARRQEPWAGFYLGADEGPHATVAAALAAGC